MKQSILMGAFAMVLVNPIDPNADIGWNTIKSNVLSTCMDCHQSKKQPELSTYSSVLAALDRVQVAIKDESMPPQRRGYSPLTLCQKSLLSRWIQDGTPEVGVSKVSSVPECK